MFEKCARLKLRFPTPKGNVTVEDLWDLPLTSTTSRANLNDIAKDLNRQLKAAADEDFVTEAKKPDNRLSLQFEIVKRIITVRMTENETAALAADRRQKKARLVELLAKKQDEELESKSVAELQALINEY